MCGAGDVTRQTVSPGQTPFTTVCPRHRDYGHDLAGIQGGDRDNFVIRLEEEEVQYLVTSWRRPHIYLDWLPGEQSRTVKLNFTCSNRCYLHTETEYYIKLEISLEEPISGEVKAYDTVAVIPP